MFCKDIESVLIRLNMRFIESWKATKKERSHGVGNKFYLSNKKDGALVFHRARDIIASFNYYPDDIL